MGGYGYVGVDGVRRGRIRVVWCVWLNKVDGIRRVVWCGCMKVGQKTM